MNNIYKKLEAFIGNRIDVSLKRVHSDKVAIELKGNSQTMCSKERVDLL